MSEVGEGGGGGGAWHQLCRSYLLALRASRYRARVVVVPSGCVGADSPDPPSRLPPSRWFGWFGSQCLNLLYYWLVENDFPLGSDGRERC